jgi:hypothetical protein
LGPPEINLQDQLFCHVGNLVFFPNTGWYTVCTITVIPLLLSPSDIRWDKRLEMIVLAVLIIFIFQILCVFVGMYGWLYKNYPEWLANETKRIYEIISYQQTHANIVFWLNHFFKVFFRHAVTIGISIGLLCHYKRKNSGSFIEYLL